VSWPFFFPAPRTYIIGGPLAGAMETNNDQVALAPRRCKGVIASFFWKDELALEETPVGSKALRDEQNE
jgi:hypothetical protein